MSLKRMRRTRRADPKEERDTHPVQEASVAEAPYPVMETALHANVVQLQSLIGNHGVQRLLSEGHINRRTGQIQRTPDPETPGSPPAPAPAAPTAVENPPAADNDPNFMEIEQGMYLGGEELHARALPKNQYYASHPPKPGWPFTGELKALWDAGQFNDFADEVAAYQHFTLKLPEAQVDGILGPKTSGRLHQSQNGSQTPESPAPAAEGTQTPAADPAGPSADTGESTPAGGSPTPAPAADDPAVSGHPAVARILDPVKQAFATYKEAENQYQVAERALNKAKKADKAAKEEERQTEMGKMEESRSAARVIMATARGQVAALAEAEFPGGPAEMKRVRGYLNRQLNAHTVYYAQGFNANILHGQGHAAAGRTCNMTVMSMMLEALGKSTKDYTGDLTKLQSLATTYEDALGSNNSDPSDLTSLRLPDFLQLVAIDIAGSRDKAAGSITSHAFITDVARSFGLKIVDIQGEVRTNKKGEDEKSFLGTKYASKLDTMGALYRPAESEAGKELNKDEAYKDLKGDAKKAYASQFVADFTDKRRLQYIANVDSWTEIDTQTKTQLEALQTELSQPNGADSAKPRFFDTEFQAKADEILKALGDISTAIPKEQEGKQKKLNALIARLQKAVDKDRKKPGAPPKNLAGLLSGKGSLVSEMEGNLKKYENLKGVYETLGKEGGAEEILPLEDYKASVIPTMQTAIDSGFQVMVNLENHFVRLQSVADDGFVIDDPGKRTGEDNKITWEQGRKNGYFKHYLLVSP